MPPRLRGSVALSAECLVPSTLPPSTTTTAVRARQFSSTPAQGRRQLTRKQERTLQWYLSSGTDIQNKNRLNLLRREDELGGGDRPPSAPSYVGEGDQPFPDNPLFKSQPVLSEECRELIWNKIVVKGETLKGVSAEMGVDVRRIAAVVRMKEVEKEWLLERKQLATPYRKAMMKMLPQHRFVEGHPENKPFEPINEVLVHKWSTNQLFVPVSESRQFTRADAATAFHKHLLPADRRVMHPELIAHEHRVASGTMRAVESNEKFLEETREQEEEFAKKLGRERERAERNTIRHRTDRFEFRIKNVDADKVGENGRKRDAVGWRYGAPLDDRKRGKIKIPTSVP